MATSFISGKINVISEASRFCLNRLSHHVTQLINALFVLRNVMSRNFDVQSKTGWAVVVEGLIRNKCVKLF